MSPLEISEIETRPLGPSDGEMHRLEEALSKLIEARLKVLGQRSLSSGPSSACSFARRVGSGGWMTR